jgi:hypothetical protein
MQSFGDDFFTNFGTVRIGGVDEVDTEFDGAAQNSNRFGAIGRLTPDAVSGDAHGAETETGDGEIVADGELAGFGGGLLSFWIPIGHGLPFPAGFGC